MKDAEMQRKVNDIIRVLSFELEQGNSCIDGALSEAQELLAALEANPPLAEVEGCDLHRYSKSPTMYHLESVFGSQGELCEEGTTILVTVTIRKS